MSLPDFESPCRALLDRFYAVHPNPMLQSQAHKALRFLRTSEKPLKGKVEGWAAGIIYAVANDARSPFGVGIPNSDFEKLMGVRMGTVYNRAAKVKELATLWS